MKLCCSEWAPRERLEHCIYKPSASISTLALFVRCRRSAVCNQCWLFPLHDFCHFGSLWHFWLLWVLLQLRFDLHDYSRLSVCIISDHAPLKCSIDKVISPANFTKTESPAHLLRLITVWVSQSTAQSHSLLNFHFSNRQSPQPAQYSPLALLQHWVHDLGLESGLLSPSIRALSCIGLHSPHITSALTCGFMPLD